MPACSEKTLAIIDKEPLFRTGLIETLTRSQAFVLAAEASSAKEAITMFDLARLDLVVLGTEAVADITSVRAKSQKALIIVVSPFQTAEDVYGAMRAGANACVPRETNAAGLVEAIRSVEATGQFYIAPAMSCLLLSHLGAQRRQVPQAILLSDREQEILSLIAAGSTNKEVAIRIGLSEKTVKHHFSIVMQKMQVRNRVEAVMKYHRLKEISVH